MVATTYLAGKLMYLLRDIVLLMLVAGFTAMLLNPAVAKVQQRIPRRGLAVMIVTLWAALVFIGLAVAFGVPLVNGITHLAASRPSARLMSFFSTVAAHEVRSPGSPVPRLLPHRSAQR